MLRTVCHRDALRFGAEPAPLLKPTDKRFPGALGGRDGLVAEEQISPPFGRQSFERLIEVRLGDGIRERIEAEIDRILARWRGGLHRTGDEGTAACAGADVT